MDEFQRDLAENLKAIETARTVLLDGLLPLTVEDLHRGRRGGWSIQEVLRHLIDAEVAYATVLGFLRTSAIEVPNASDDDVVSASAAIAALERTRKQLVALLDGVDENTFYDMRSLGTNEYSVMSVLENVADHDHEHLSQIVKTLASGGTSA